MADKQNAVLSLKAAYAFGNDHGLQDEISAIKEMEIEWDRSYDSTVRRGYIINLFERANLFDEFVQKNWPQGKTSSGRTYIQRCLRIRQQYEDYLAGLTHEESVIDSVNPSDGGTWFQLESELRDFIAGNLSSIPVRGQKLSLFIDVDGRRGFEYPTGVGPIDILATDQNGCFVVFELKRAGIPDHAIGQVARYMGWVQHQLAKGREVYGVIVAKSISEKLQYAIKVVPNVSLFEYDVQFSLRSSDQLSR